MSTTQKVKKKSYCKEVTCPKCDSLLMKVKDVELPDNIIHIRCRNCKKDIYI